jgi:hypothetical protein
VLVARSAPECRLYLELHPCSCGESRFDVRQRQRFADGGLVSVYDGLCPRCGLPRHFEFGLDPATPPPPPAFGGDTPSRIICPGQFALVAARAAGSAPTSPPDGEQDRARGRALLERAVEAQSEIIKFVVPAGAAQLVDAVPPGAFTSPEGQSLYAAEPDRFTLDRLQAVLDSYRALLSRY